MPDLLPTSLTSKDRPDGVGPESRDLSMPILPAEPDMFPEDLWEGIADDEACSARRWYCLHTKPRQEKATARDLRAREVPYYLPQMIREDRTPAGRKIRSLLPLFGSYMFLFG